MSLLGHRRFRRKLSAAGCFYVIDQELNKSLDKATALYICYCYVFNVHILSMKYPQGTKVIFFRQTLMNA